MPQTWLAWFLNIRVRCRHGTSALSDAIVHRTENVDWYVDRRKILAATQRDLSTAVAVCAILPEFLAGLAIRVPVKPSASILRQYRRSCAFSFLKRELTSFLPPIPACYLKRKRTQP